MDLFYEPHREILKSFTEFGVAYIMIGGYAVNYHGFSRPTGDMDLWLKPTEENKQTLLKMLVAKGFDEDTLNYIRTLDFSKPEVFFMGQEPVRIDFLTHVSGVKYEDADKKKIIADIEGMPIAILHLQDLLLTKTGTGRTKDKLDVEELQKIQALKQHKT